MAYESRKLVSDDGQSAARSTENPQWRGIRELSVRQFVDKVSKVINASGNSKLRADLYESVLNDGLSVRYGSAVYTPAMQLDIYRRRDDA